jgi:hypothetical protein
MPHLCRLPDHHEIGLHRARDAGQGDRIVADFPIAQARLEIARSLITDHGASTRNARGQASGVEWS